MEVDYNLLKRILYFLSVFLLLTSISFGQLRGSSIRSPYINKFLILKKLSRLATKNDKAVEKAAYQQMIKVIFRNGLLLYTLKNNNLKENLDGVATYLNSKVKRIFTGIKNFNGCAKVADWQQKDDRHLIQVIANLISNEIGQTTVSTKIMKAFAKIDSDINSSKETIQKNNTQYREHNLSVIRRLKEALDMSRYIYQEQIRWLMTSLYKVESLAEQIRTNKPGNVNKTSLIEVDSPPVVYIPNFSGKDWSLY